MEELSKVIRLNFEGFFFTLTKALFKIQEEAKELHLL